MQSDMNEVELTNLSGAPQQPAQVLKPSEILSIFSDYLAKSATSSKVIYVRGVYSKAQKFEPAWKYAYDSIKDEDDHKEITVLTSRSIRDRLKDGALVLLGGNIHRVLKDNGMIQLQLHVTRVEVVQDQAISEEDIIRAEIRNEKSRAGYKNVDSILEDILYRGLRPRVALVFASTSITMSDFNAGKEAASTMIDFTECRVPFSKPQELAELLSKLDQSNSFDAIALVRGGGGGIEALDDLTVLKCLLNLTIPLICAVGHVEEKIFIKNIADKVAPTPNGLGAYFKDMVESVAARRNNSRAALVEEVKKQYIQQIETAEKQNKALQEQIEKMTKASAEAQGNFKAQSDALTKQLATLQENLKKMNETNLEQTRNFNDTISEMQKTNAALQDSIAKLTQQNATSAANLLAAKAQADELYRQLVHAKGFRTALIIITVASIIIALLTALI